MIVTLIIILLSLGLQIYEYSRVETIKVISLDYTWNEAKQALGWYALGLLILNYFSYKMHVFGTVKNQIVNGMLACSVLALLYISLSYMLLPYLFFARLGMLHLFFI